MKLLIVVLSFVAAPFVAGCVYACGGGWSPVAQGVVTNALLSGEVAGIRGDEAPAVGEATVDMFWNDSQFVTVMLMGEGEGGRWMMGLDVEGPLALNSAATEVGDMTVHGAFACTSTDVTGEWQTDIQAIPETASVRVEMHPDDPELRTFFVEAEFPSDEADGATQYLAAQFDMQVLPPEEGASGGGGRRLFD